MRELKGEVVLVSRLRAELERLNPALPPEAITAAVDELTRDRSAMSLEEANCEVYRLLKEGIPVSVMERDLTSGRAELPLRPNVGGGAATPPYQKGGRTTVRVQVIDWEKQANNNFQLISQFGVTTRSTPAGRIWSGSSTACRWWSTRHSLLICRLTRLPVQCIHAAGWKRGLLHRADSKGAAILRAALAQPEAVPV